jgi:uncharacterized protein (TIGR02996 family)
MDTQAALLRALHDDPADETSWLALADWLEEDDHPEQAELLRLDLVLRHEPLGTRRAEREARLCALLASGVRPCRPELVNSLGMRLSLIPPGAFWMGSPDHEAGRDAVRESPRHRVQITRGFYLGVYPVTQAEYEAVTGTNPSGYSTVAAGVDRVQDARQLPVETVSWPNASAFGEKLSELPEERSAGRAYRLPTEAEWEYACRAGTTSVFHYGDTLGPDQANIMGTGLRRTTVVGTYRPNAWGLYDMHGNVWEWCQDLFEAGYYANSPRGDPQGPATAAGRVLRGGGWCNEANGCRSAQRYWGSHTDAYNFLGFRVALTVRGR